MNIEQACIDARYEKRELAEGRAVMFRGDSVSLLRAGFLKNDAIVTDPPYGISFIHSGGGIGGALKGQKTESNIKKIYGDDAPFDPSPWIAAAPRTETKNISGYGGESRIVLFGADNFLNKLPTGGTLLAWDKNCGVGADDSFSDCEWAWSGKKVKREVFRWLWKGIICKKTSLDHSPTKNGAGYGGAKFARVHVSQKPVELMRWCIEKIKPPENGVILDPYCGSGSTGIAALSLGFRFIGVEFDEENFEIACRRIEYYWDSCFDQNMPLFD